MDNLNSIIPILFIIVIIGGISLLFILQYVIKINRPYIKKENLLTPTEVKFYQILKLAVDNHFDIFTQVRMANLIDVKQGSLYFWKHFGPIGMKSMDFVLCDKTTSKVLVVIELDDYTHKFAHRQKRDAFVDDALKTVKIPIIHQEVQSWYNVNDLKQKIANALRQY